jgi:hypothetical protein
MITFYLTFVSPDIILTYLKKIAKKIGVVPLRTTPKRIKRGWLV